MEHRVAVAQAPYLRDSEQAFLRLVRQMHQAVSRGAEVVVFPEWSLGLNPVEVLPNRWTERVAQSARDLGLMVITGSVRALDVESGKKQQRGLVIDRDGRLLGSQAKMHFQPVERPWFEPGAALAPIATRLGSVVLLLGLDAQDPQLLEEVVRLDPALVVMTPLLRNTAERQLVHEGARQLSQAIAGQVVVAPLMGRFSGVHYLGGCLIAQRGRVLTAGEDREGVYIGGEAEAPTVQLGVTDVSAPVKGQREGGMEAERRVFGEWEWLKGEGGMLQALELVQGVGNNPRQAVLAPVRAGAGRELERLFEAGARGGMAYPALDGLYPWSEAFMALGPILNRHRLPLVVASGSREAPLRFQRPLEWDDFLLAYPSVPLILLHLGGGSPFYEEALLLAERHPQVWLETSLAPVAAIREAVAALGPGRLLFGSGGPAADFSREWAKWQGLEADLSPQAFQAVINHNGRNLFFVPREHDGEVGRKAEERRDRLTVIRRPS